jgi:hypothetical protein
MKNEVVESPVNRALKEDKMASIHLVSRFESFNLYFGRIFSFHENYLFVDFSDSSKIIERYYDYEKIEYIETRS